MAWCTKCGFRLDDEALFCSRCGAQLAPNKKLNKTDGKTFVINSNGGIHFSEEMIDYINVTSPFIEVIDKNQSALSKTVHETIDITNKNECAAVVLAIIQCAIAAGMEVLSEYDLDDDYDEKYLESQTIPFIANRYGFFLMQDFRSALAENDIEFAKECLICGAVASVCDVSVYIYNLLIQEQCFLPVDFMKNCAIEDAKYKKWKKTNEKANQIFSEYENKNLSTKEATSKLCKCISEYPQCAIAYAYIYAIDPSTSTRLLNVAKFCGMEKEFQSFLDSDKNGIFNFALRFSGRNPHYR